MYKEDDDSKIKLSYRSPKDSLAVDLALAVDDIGGWYSPAIIHEVGKRTAERFLKAGRRSLLPVFVFPADEIPENLPELKVRNGKFGVFVETRDKKERTRFYNAL